jgi:hypothetical protein
MTEQQLSSEIGGFVHELNKRVEVIVEHMMNGGIKSFEDYRSLIGEIKGLNYAKQLVIDYVKKLEDEDE